MAGKSHQNRKRSIKSQRRRTVTRNDVTRAAIIRRRVRKRSLKRTTRRGVRVKRKSIVDHVVYRKKLNPIERDLPLVQDQTLR